MVTVATGDRLQRDMVMAMGASVIGAEALRQVVPGRRRRPSGTTPPAAARPGSPTGSRIASTREVRRQLDRLRRPAPPTDGARGVADDPR